MIIIETIKELRAYLKQVSLQGLTIALVPTMGYLHEGHLSLVTQAKENSDVVVMSIFVNPLQFGPNEDFERYPRDMPRDITLAERTGVDVLFVPSRLDMYPKQPLITVNVTGISNFLCGRSRPGHFDGVATVVTKLLNIVKPNRVYFGQKDAQQVAVIRRMMSDLNYDIEVIACPIVRESDGLAMSSRNAYLSAEQRKEATVLCESILRAEMLFEHGERCSSNIISPVKELINTKKLAQIDYVEIVNGETFYPVAMIEHTSLLALAVYFGKTRLIDNCILNPDKKE